MLQEILTYISTLDPAVIYLVTIVTYARFRSSFSFTMGRFTMGRWATPIIMISIIWLGIELAILTVPEQFHEVTYMSAAIMATGIVLQFLFFRKLQSYS